MLLPRYPNKSMELDFIDKDHIILNAVRSKELDDIDSVALRQHVCDVCLELDFVDESISGIEKEASILILASSHNKKKLADIEIDYMTGKILNYREEKDMLEHELAKRIYKTENESAVYAHCSNIKIYEESLGEVEKILGRKLEIIPTNWEQERRVDSKNHMKYLAYLTAGNVVVEYKTATEIGKVAKFI
jgi:hypothetical protein